MAKDPTNEHSNTHPTPRVEPSWGSVGILSTSSTGIQDVARFVTQEGVSVSRTILVPEADLRPSTGGAEMQDGLRVLQRDPATDTIVLISATTAPGAVERVLAQVGKSRKPNVVCFLGADRRLLWKAGAIPATRLDEAAMRAAAWVQGRDQALISSSLEEQDERLALRAAGLRAWIGPERQLLQGIFVSQILLTQAQLMLDDVAGEASWYLHQVPDREAQLHHLRDACADPRVALVLLDTVPVPETDSRLSHTLASVLREHPSGPLLITHMGGMGNDPQQQAGEAAIVRNSRAILLPSNAAAARLAGMVLARQVG